MSPVSSEQRIQDVTENAHGARDTEYAALLIAVLLRRPPQQLQKNRAAQQLGPDNEPGHLFPHVDRHVTLWNLRHVTLTHSAVLSRVQGVAVGGIANTRQPSDHLLHGFQQSRFIFESERKEG